MTMRHDVDQARSDYSTIMAALRSERAIRDRVLLEPRRSTAIAEIDAAIAALERLGQIIAAAAAAGIVERPAEQAPLLDLPSPNPYQ